MRFFRKNKSDERKDVTFDFDQQDLVPQALSNAVAKAEAAKPDLEQHATAKELYNNVMEVLRDVDTCRVETALGIMGSLAGFSCLLPEFKKYERGEIEKNSSEFEIVDAFDGQRLFFGNRINVHLLEDEKSVWSIVKKQAKDLGARKMPDVAEISKYTTSSSSSKEFGMPRLPVEHMPLDLPVNFVRHLMPSYVPLLARYNPDVDKFHVSLAYAVAKIMKENKEVLSPTIAAKIVMECAVPMSKIDPASVL